MDGNEANTEEIREICKVKENILERGRLSSRLEALPRGEIIPGVLDMPGTPQKSKVATKLAEKLEEFSKTKGKPRETKHFLSRSFSSRPGPSRVLGVITKGI